MATLKNLVDQYASEPFIATNTENFRRCSGKLVCKCFGERKHPKSLKASDMGVFRVWLTERDFSELYRHRICTYLRSLFNYAEQEGVVAKSPFGPLKWQPAQDRSRQFFVTPAMYAVLYSELSPEMRAVLALLRYGGLRAPSEIAALRWGDFNFQDLEFRVTSSKTKHVGKADRMVPLFPQITEALLEYRPADWEPGDWVFTSPTTKYLWRPRLLEAFKRLGWEPWPKLFINCRSSRITELVQKAGENFSIFDVACWMGHSPQTMLKYYAQVSSEARRRAAVAV